MSILLLLLACTPTHTQPRNGEYGTTDTSGTYGSYVGTPTADQPPGGFAITTGLALDELSWIEGPAVRCGEEPMLVLADHTGDGLPELGIGCQDPGDGWRVDLHVLDGGAALSGNITTVAHLNGRSKGASALGDLDGDGLTELGFGIPTQTLNGAVADLDWWWVQPGNALAEGNPIPLSTAIAGESQQYGGGPPVAVGDVDGDGVVDMVVWQVPGSLDPLLSVISGADLAAGTRLTLATDAIRTVSGFTREQVPGDVAATSDLDGDGYPGIAISIGVNQRPPAL